MSKHKPASRRWQAALILTLFGIAVAAAAFGGWWYARESPPHQGPIVLVSVTGLGVGELAAYGSARSSSPAIDALAEDGVVFERVYAHALQTLPAHASLLTGLLPIDHHVRDNAGFVLDDGVRTLAELLRNRGFSTGAAVSSFLLRRQSGIAQGFSFFDGELADGPADGAPMVERDGTATWEAAEQWMRRQNGQRFFLMIQTGRAGADPIVGRLISSLRARRLYDPATIMIVGDPAGESEATTLAEQTLRVPLIVKQPDETGAGRRADVLAQHVDLVPTLLDLVRAPIPSGLPGRSLRPVLDDSDGVVPDQPIYSESLDAHFELGGAGSFALTSRDYQYVRGPRETLTALGPDGERRPADASSPEADRLRSALDRLLASRTIDLPARVPQAEEDQYSVLGYLPNLRLTVPAADAAANDPALLSAHRLIARLAGEKRFPAAIEGLRALTRSHSRLPVLEYQLGSLLVRTNRLDEAIAAFRAAAALLPDTPEIPMTIADALMQSRRYDDASAEAALAIALAERVNSPARAEAHEAAVRIALARNDFEAATRHAEEAHSADPSRPLPQFVRGRLLYHDGRYEEALAAFQEAETALGDDGALEDLHYYLADTFARLDQYEEAELQFRQELQLFPRNISPYSSLAMLYRASNRHRDVERVIRDLMEAVPTPEGYAMAARLWMILGERSRAEAVRLDARSRFRGDPSLALIERRR